MGLIFSLFNTASAQDLPFGILQYIQYILHGITSVLPCVHSSLLTAKSVNLVVAHDDFLGVMDIVCTFIMATDALKQFVL